MTSMDWQKVTLKTADCHVIPTICPNCLDAATVDCRYAYVPAVDSWNPIYLLDRGRYFQTFYYCSRCAELVEKQQSLGWTFLIGAIFGLATLAACGYFIGSGLDEITKNSAGAALVGVPCLLYAYAMSRLAYQAVKSLVMRIHPLREGQAVWGAAAYYAGPSLVSGGDVYTAARPEWLEALVQSNSG